MKIEISDDTLYGLVIDVLVRDYRYLKADIERFTQKPILSDVEQTDLLNWNIHLRALHNTIQYYAGYGWEDRYES